MNAKADKKRRRNYMAEQKWTCLVTAARFANLVENKFLHFTTSKQSCDGVPRMSLENMAFWQITSNILLTIKFIYISASLCQDYNAQRLEEKSRTKESTMLWHCHHKRSVKFPVIKSSSARVVLACFT